MSTRPDTLTIALWLVAPHGLHMDQECAQMQVGLNIREQNKGVRQVNFCQ
jgi:hypothetical protein